MYIGFRAVPLARNSGDGAECVSEYSAPNDRGMLPGLRIPSVPHMLLAFRLGLRYSLRAEKSAGIVDDEVSDEGESMGHSLKKTKRS